MSRHPKVKQRKLPRKDRVVVSWLFPDKVDGRFMASMLNMMNYDLHVAGGRIQNGGSILPLQSGPNLNTARNKQAATFLDEFDADWLLIVDSDMTFEPHALEALMLEADPEKAPVVGGLCFGKKETADELSYWATMYGFDTSGDKITTYRFESWEENAMFPVHATGTAFLLIHRGVLEAVREKFADRAPWIWFEEMNDSGYVWGEDTTFCLRVLQCGFPIYVHTGVEVGHMKPQRIDAKLHTEWKAAL